MQQREVPEFEYCSRLGFDRLAVCGLLVLRLGMYSCCCCCWQRWML
jgi:hypothetical protein